jgi:hypothetical protein
MDNTNIISNMRVVTVLAASIPAAAQSAATARFAGQPLFLPKILAFTAADVYSCRDNNLWSCCENPT